MTTATLRHHRTVDSKPTRRLLPADALTVYPEVQRVPPGRASVKQIADHLDLSKLGMLTVSERADGTFSIIDGQRRAAALKMAGLGATRIDCLVYTGLTQEQEADLFIGLNNTRVVNAADRFFVGLTAKLPECTGIAAVCARHRLAPSRGSGVNHIACVGALLRVWRMDDSGALLDRTLDVLLRTFGRDRTTTVAQAIVGMALFLHENPDADDSALVTKVQSKFRGTTQLVAHAQSRAKEEGGSVYHNVSELLARVYSARKARTG